MASGRPWCRHGRRCFSGMRTAATRSGSRHADASRPVDSGGDRQPDLCRAGARSHGDGRAVEVESCDAVPERHGYSLSDNRGRAALARIAEHGVPVVLTQHWAERRQRHAWDRTEDPTMNARLAAAKAHPGLRFALNNWAALGGHQRREAGLKGRGDRLCADAEGAAQEVSGLSEALGVEAVAFGLHAPFDDAVPALVKLANLERLPAADFERTAWRDALAFSGSRREGSTGRFPRAAPRCPVPGYAEFSAGFREKGRKSEAPGGRHGTEGLGGVEFDIARAPRITRADERGGGAGYEKHRTTAAQGVEGAPE